MAWAHDGSLEHALTIARGAVAARAEVLNIHLTSLPDYMVRNYGSGAGRVSAGKEGLGLGVYEYLASICLSDEDWEAVARQWFDEEEGRPKAAYDPRLSKAMAQIDLSRQVPDLWPQFMALTDKPTLAIRGENSDLLSMATFEQMRERHPMLRSLLIEAQGHAPLLREPPVIDAIAEFLADTDGLPKQ